MAEPKDEKKNPTEKDVADNIDSVRDVLDEAGFAVRLIKRNPEIKEIIKKLGNRLAKGRIDEREIYREFKKLLDETEFGQRPSTEISADLARYRENNQDFKQTLANLEQEIRTVANMKMGKGIGSKETRDLALSLIYSNDGFLAGQFDKTEIDRRLSQFLVVEDTPSDTDPYAMTELGGDAGNSQDTLLRWFAANGVQVGANAMQKYLRDLQSGVTTIDQIKQDTRERVFSSKYGAYADRFKEGLDVTDISLDFRNATARMLELNQNEVSLDHRLVRKAMEYVDPATGKNRPVSGWEFEKMIREDPDWQKTNNAHEQYATVGRDLLKTFGFEV